MRSITGVFLIAVLLLAAAGRSTGEEAKPAASEKSEKIRDKAALIEARDKIIGELAGDPKNVRQWKRLAMVQRHLGDEKGTEEALTKAAALDPKDAGVAFMRGLLHEKRGDGAKASEAFRACLDYASQAKIRELCTKHLRRTEKP